MNNIKLILGDNFNDINKAIIKKINIADFSYKNFVIVPDRFSLLTEKLIFKTLHIKAYFNIEVVGISDFANYIFEKLGLNLEYVNKQESKILIRKALKSVKNNLKFFVGEIDSGLIDVIYNSISLLKTNRIYGEDLNNLGEEYSNILLQKMEDLSLILSEYNKLLNGKLDSSEILEKLSYCLETFDAKNLNLFYVNFDSFTKQGFEILKKLAKTANSVYVGAVYPNKQKNAHIYEDDVSKKILDFAKAENINVETEKIIDTLEENQKQIKNNLFATKPDIKKSDFIKVFQSDNLETEIEDVAKIIKYLITKKNIKYNQIAVACGDLETSKNFVEKIFNKFDFAFFLDTEINLIELETAKFILDILKTILTETDITNFNNILNSPFVEISENDKIFIFDYLEKYDIKNNILFTENKNEKIENVLINLKNKINKLKINKNSEKNINYYIILIKNIILEFNLEKQNNLLIEKFREKSFIKQEKFYEQIFDKFEKILQSLEKIINEEICEKDFLEIFENYLSEQNLSTIPLTTDSIFVGDATTSFFDEVDYLFIINANENILPRYINDTAIISDDVIEKLSGKITFSPTVKMINRRSKFKLFSLLLNAKSGLYLFYHTDNSEGKKGLPAYFVKELVKIFDTKIKNLGFNLTTDFYLPKEEFIGKFIFNVGTKNYAQIEYLKAKTFATIQNEGLKIIANVLDKNGLNEHITETKIDNIKEIFFDKNKTKISQIEKFYDCPFKHFVVYGLKLFEKETAQINNAEVGQFLHKVAEEFLSPKNNFLQLINENKLNIDEIIKKIIKKCENNIIFNKFLLKINNSAKNIVEKESKNLCKYLYESSKKTKFKTKFVEVRFGSDEFSPLKINVCDEEFKLVGVVDRVDVFDDMFVIIDYKTGKNGKASFDELYYGEKLQIFVYAKALSEILEQKPSGIFYFPISNDFNDENQNPYVLAGKNLNSQKFLNNFDSSLNFDNNKSTIFNCKLKVNKTTLQTGEKEYYATSNMTAQNVFDASLSYSVEMVKNALQEILQGEISASPRENSCMFCPYFSLCQKSKNQSPRKKIYKIDKSFEDYLLKGDSDE